MKNRFPHPKFIVAVIISSGFATIGLLGGLGIESVKEQLLLFSPLLIALPAMNAMAGDYATIITAHVGDPETKTQTIRKLFIALAVSLPVSIVGVISMSLFVAHLQGYILTLDVFYQYVTFVSLAIIGVVIMTLLSIFLLNKMLNQHHLNSDDVLIPAANTLASVFMLTSFAIIIITIS